jgi:anti-sigma28 factor (negative regulator of flagellin synthesis)
MNVNDPNRSFAGSSAGTSRARQTIPSIPTDDIHLSELLRCLRSLVSDSPERQAKIEGLMLAYANGDLEVDAEATASAIIDDAILHRPALR